MEKYLFLSVVLLLFTQSTYTRDQEIADLQLLANHTYGTIPRQMLSIGIGERKVQAARDRIKVVAERNLRQ